MKKINFNFCRLIMSGAFLFFSVSGAMAQDVANGFASVSGDGLSTTTGGGNSTSVTVNTYDELKSQCSSSSALVIIVDGTIAGSKSITVKSNKTIQGKGNTAKLSGFGLDMNTVSNIIIKDLKITGSVDGIAARNTHHLWIDHCEIWDCTDGLIDITRASSYCTVSWCKLYYVSQSDHRLACLIGNGGGTAPDDWGRNKVTYHHNWFGTKVDQRQPRLMYGQGHVYNNYYTCSGNSYCVGVGSYGMALIENNYFKDVKNPHYFMYDVYCHITANGNIYDNTSGSKETGLGGSRKVDGQDFDVVPFTNAPYSYSMDNASNVPSTVSNGAGPRSSTSQISVTGVTVIPTSVSVNAGATAQLTATVAPSNASNKTVSWSSSNTSIATVSSSGLVTGQVAGSATITVTTQDGNKKATSAITVKESNSTTITIQENETGFCSVDGSIDNNNSGFTGTGFANTDNASGDGITWSVNILASGNYNLVWRYANGGSSDRTAQFMVDGSTEVSNVSMPATGSWTNWEETSSISVYLSAGTKTVRLQATNSSGLANIDYVTISGGSLNAVACSGLKSAEVTTRMDNNKADVDVICYPVPVDDLLNIKFSKEQCETVDIYLFDITGKAVKYHKAKGSSCSLDMSGLSAGSYTLKIVGENLDVTKHVAKR